MLSVFLLLLAPVLLFVFTLLFAFFVFDSVLRGHSLSTSRRAIEELSNILNARKPRGGNFYDLGCARGSLALAVKGKFSHFSVHAIDNSTIRIFFARLKAVIFRQKICFQKADIFKTNLTNADIVYTYLWYDLMPPLEEKLQKELKKGAIVITNTSNFPNWKPKEKHVTCPNIHTPPDFETLFVYIKE